MLLTSTNGRCGLWQTNCYPCCADAVNIEDVGRWRRAARLAGRRLRERIRTGVAADGARVWAVSLDHEVTEGDLTRAGRAMDALLDERRRD